MSYYSKVSYTGDGSTATFSVPFSYIDKAHVSATVNGSPATIASWPSSSQVTLSPAPANGSTVWIARTTPRNALLVTWPTPVDIKASKLNLAATQALYIIQEALDAASDSLSLTWAGVWDARSKRILNVADALSGNDAVNFTQAEGRYMNRSYGGKWNALSTPIGNLPWPVVATDAASKDFVENSMSSQVAQAQAAATDAELARDVAVAAAGANTPVFPSKASLAASSTTSSIVRVAEENAEATYVYDPSTTSGAVAVTAGGRKYRNIEKVLRPAMFGASPSASAAANLQAFKDLATELRWRGGGRVEFPENKTFNHTLANTEDMLFNLAGCKGVDFRFNGSKLVDAQDYNTNAWTGYIFGLYGDTRRVRIFDLDYTESTATGNSPRQDRGIRGVSAFDGCKDVELHGITMFGGLAGFIAGRTGSFNHSDRARDLNVIGADFNTTYYCINFQRNGDLATFDNIYSRGAGRTYFVYNVTQHTGKFDTRQAGPFNDFLLKVYADNTEADQENTLADIKLQIRSQQRDVALDGQAICAIEAQHLNATPARATFRNIDLSFDVGHGSFNQASLLRTYKFLSNGSVDNSGTSHYFEGITVRGYAEAYDYGTDMVHLFDPADGGWSSDIIKNLTFRDFMADGSSTQIYVNSAVCQDLTFENVKGTAPVSLGTIPAGALDASKSVNLSNLKSALWADPGYKRLPNGMIEQFGTVSVGNNSNTAVSFPVAFRSGTTPIVEVSRNGSGNSGDFNFDVTNATVTVSRTASGAAGAIAFHWRAIGQI